MPTINEGKKEMAPEQWLEANKEAIETRYNELAKENPGATILKPGYHQAINGKQYFNTRFIVAK